MLAWCHLSGNGKLWILAGTVRGKGQGTCLRQLERAEDLSPAALNAGVPWSWETFGEYFDAVDALPKGINYSGYLGHSALRTHVMGERAFEAKANNDDMTAMAKELQNAMQAGAVGFSTSRSLSHRTPDGKPVRLGLEAAKDTPMARDGS